MARVRNKVRVRFRVANYSIQTAGEGDKMRINHVIKTDQWRCAPQIRPAPHFVVSPNRSLSAVCALVSSIWAYIIAAWSHDELRLMYEYLLLLTTLSARSYSPFSPKRLTSVNHAGKFATCCCAMFVSCLPHKKSYSGSPIQKILCGERIQFKIVIGRHSN